MLINDFKEYCKNKNIVIVGNSSTLQYSKYSHLIDSHDIVVRINNAYPIKNEFRKNIGIKTDVYAISISRKDIAKSKLKGNNLKYILRLNKFEKDLPYENIIYGNRKEYNELKLKFNNFKPSTGSIIINFFKNNIDYKKLTLIGFDFFKSESSIIKNKFGSFKYREHSEFYEKQFVYTALKNNKIHLVK